MCCPQLVIVKVWEGSFASASGHSSPPELGLSSRPSGLLCPPPSVPRPAHRDLPFHALLSSAVPTVLCAPAVHAHTSLLLFTSATAAGTQNCVCGAL